MPRARTLLLLAALLLALLPDRPAAAGGTAGWDWPLPAPHPVTRAFAPGPHPWSPGHRGVDLAAPAGTAVLAAGAGRIVFAGPLAGRGVVVVDHGAVRTTYEPVSATVPVGAAVRTGDRLGTLDAGHAGCPAPACLHWGLLRGDTYLDPLRLVEAGPVRLLPRTGPPGGAAGAAAVLVPPARAADAERPAAAEEVAGPGPGGTGGRGAGLPAVLGAGSALALAGARRRRTGRTARSRAAPRTSRYPPSRSPS